jgi:hypothetical protein
MGNDLDLSPLESVICKETASQDRQQSGVFCSRLLCILGGKFISITTVYDLYGSPSQLPAMGISPGFPKLNTISAKPTELELRNMN